MAKSLQVVVVSAESELYSGTASYVSATAQMGELGVTPGHTPLLTQLAPGNVRVVKENDEEEIIYISGGMLEIQPDVVTILSDTAIRAEDIDEQAALEAKQRAEEQIAQQKEEYDFARARAELAQAAARLRTLQKLRETGRK